MREKDKGNDSDTGSEGNNLDQEDPDTIFEFHGNRKQFSKRSLFLFNYDGFIRLKFVSFIMHPYFDNTVIALIILNSLMLGGINYDQINRGVPT